MANNTLQFSDFPLFEGKRQIPFPKLLLDVNTEMNRIRDLNLHKTDILICAFPKSGTHWVNEIVYMLMMGTAEYSPIAKEDFFLDRIDIGQIETMKSPRILNTHVCYGHLPKTHLSNGGKIIHITRNPKDVMVSFYHHAINSITFVGMASPWPEYFQRYCSGEIAKITPSSLTTMRKKNFYGGWFGYENEFEMAKLQHPEYQILSLYFENLKQFTEQEIKKIAGFLGISYSEGLIKDITEKCDFTNMKNNKYDDKSETFSVNKRSFMYRKGEIGDWKNWFTVSQNEQFDNLYAENMKDSKLKPYI